MGSARSNNVKVAIKWKWRSIGEWRSIFQTFSQDGSQLEVAFKQRWRSNRGGIQIKRFYGMPFVIKKVQKSSFVFNGNGSKMIRLNIQPPHISILPNLALFVKGLDTRGLKKVVDKNMRNDICRLQRYQLTIRAS